MKCMAGNSVEITIRKYIKNEKLVSSPNQWATLLFDPGRVEIEPTVMEVNCVAEALFILEATAMHPNHHDLAVDALGTTIIGFKHHGIEIPQRYSLIVRATVLKRSRRRLTTQ